MSKESELRKCIVYRARSKFNLIYGIPIGAALILFVLLLSYWLPIPTWLVAVIAGIELLVFFIDATNIVILNGRIRKLRDGMP